VEKHVIDSPVLNIDLEEYDKDAVSLLMVFKEVKKGFTRKNSGVFDGGISVRSGPEQKNPC
jgi:hypothetical protein